MSFHWRNLQSLILGVLLIAGFSASLLVYDWGNRVHALPQPVEQPGRTAGEDLPFQGRPQAEPGQQYQIGVVYLAEERDAETAFAGLLDGLREFGYLEGENLLVDRRSAHGKIDRLQAALEELDAGPSQAIVTLSTPALVAALDFVQDKPVVFTHVMDPLAAGAGPGWEEHQANVTGIGSFPPMEATMDLFGETFPGNQKLATIDDAGETGSGRIVARLRELCQQRGVELVEKTVPAAGNLAEACRALVAEQPTAIYVPDGALPASYLDTVLPIAAAAKVPVLIDAPAKVEQPGVLAAVGIGHYFAGKEAAGPLAEVLRGRPPADIPLRNYTLERVVLNFDTAEKLGIDIPGSIMILHDPEAIPSGSLADQRSPFQPPPAKDS